MEYYAVTKTDPSTELTHWKYIKREKVNGKWRYTYERDNGYVVTLNDKDSHDLTAINDKISAIENKYPRIHASLKEYRDASDEEKKKIDDELEAFTEESYQLARERDELRKNIMERIDALSSVKEIPKSYVNKGGKYLRTKLLIK